MDPHLPDLMSSQIGQRPLCVDHLVSPRQLSARRNGQLTALEGKTPAPKATGLGTAVPTDPAWTTTDVR